MPLYVVSTQNQNKQTEIVIPIKSIVILLTGRLIGYFSHTKCTAVGGRDVTHHYLKLYSPMKHQNLKPKQFRFDSTCLS